MSSDLKMAPNDKRDSRFHDSRKESPDGWGKSPRHSSDATSETNRNDPHSIRCRVFIGNLPAEMKSKELEDTFSQYGRVMGVSVHNNYGFVQFEDDKSADAAVAKENGKFYYGKCVDVNLAGDRRKPKMDDRPRDRDTRPPFPFRREREFDRDGRPFRKSPPRERPRFEDYDRFPSRFEPPFDRRGRSPSPPPPRRMDDRPGYGRHDDYYMRDRYRDEPPHHREPYPRHFDHRGEPFDRDRRDPYDSPRGPYHDRRDNHYDRYDSYSRDYSRPDDYPGPAKRPRMDYNDRPDDTYSSSKNIEAPTDCVIVVMNKQQRGYAEMVERRLKSVGLVVELHFHGTQPISELLDDVARRGVLYAIVITSQHEIHRSVTVNILHGTPQEHRNMPLDDAMRLVGQNFDQYMQDLRERAKSSSNQDLGKSKTTAPKEEEKSDITTLLSKAATGADLSADQLTKLIDSLSKRQQELMGSSTTTTNGKGGITGSQSSQPAVDPQSIAKQQADLQAKILSILNPGGGGGGGATTGSALNTSLASQKTVLSGQITGAVTAPSAQTTAKPALSTSVKPIFPLYPAQQKPAASSAGTAVSTARAPLGTTTAKPLYSTTANQVGKPYPSASASPRGSTSASSAYGAATATAYQFSKPVAQNTYTVGSNQGKGAAATSPAVYGSQTTAAQGYAAGTQGVQRIGQPQQKSVTSASVPVSSKFSPAGQAIATIGAQRPGVTSAQRMVAPTAGPRLVSGVSAGQVRAPAGRGLLGAAPAGTPRVTTPSAAVRTPSPSGLRMAAPRGPSPVGRGTVRTASPASMQGQTVPSRGGAISVRGGAISVRGGVSGAGRGGAASQTTTPVRGGLAQRGAPATAASFARGGIAARGGPVARGAPATRGVTVARGTPAPRGAVAMRGAHVPRGTPVSRGTPASRGAPATRGAPTARGTGMQGPRGASSFVSSAPGGRGGPSTRGAPIRTVTPGAFPIRGAPRGGPMMRGAPPFRGGRGNYGGRGGY